MIRVLEFFAENCKLGASRNRIRFMGLYTRKGDTGTTKKFDTKPGERIPKAGADTEALGALDELNSYLGLLKAKSKEVGMRIGETGPWLDTVVHGMQENLFIIQAEIAGAPKKITHAKVNEAERFIDRIERDIPPIKSFLIPGGTEASAFFDVVRALARRAERRVIVYSDGAKKKLGGETLAYLNRLSSLLYALARLVNWRSGITEVPPAYK